MMTNHYHHINFRITHAWWFYTIRGSEQGLMDVHRNPQERKTVHGAWERLRNLRQYLSLAWYLWPLCVYAGLLSSGRPARWDTSRNWEEVVGSTSALLITASWSTVLSLLYQFKGQRKANKKLHWPNKSQLKPVLPNICPLWTKGWDQHQSQRPCHHK